MIEKTVNVSLGERSYPINIGKSIYADLNSFRKHITGKQVFIISNDTIAPYYLVALTHALSSQFECHTLLLPDGEQYKSVDQWMKILDKLIETQQHRSTTLIALGGGVIGDMVGFAAASYQRGVDFIQIPTTLLAQVDASVGGKTAINHPLAKNMIGAFHQPKAVIIDINLLKTLPQREYLAGLAEVIKYGLIRDFDFFCWLETAIDKLIARDDNAIMYAIQRSCEIKAAIVNEDEMDHGIRALLNYGHTFGHAIESATNYQTYLHGEAIAIGMLMAGELSQQLNLFSPSEKIRAQSLIEKLGVTKLNPTHSPEQLYQLMVMDKKNVTNEARFIVLNALGSATLVDNVSKQTVLDIIKGFLP